MWFTKFESSSAQHRQELERLRTDLPGAFRDTGEGTPPILPQTNASAMNFGWPTTTYRDKCGSHQIGKQAAYRYGLNSADELEELVAALS